MWITLRKTMLPHYIEHPEIVLFMKTKVNVYLALDCFRPGENTESNDAPLPSGFPQDSLAPEDLAE
jgi:hypothetical protein